MTSTQETKDGRPTAAGIDPDMSPSEFANWHVEDTLFVRDVVLKDGTVAYAVYGADGTFLDVVQSMGEVILAAHSQDMEIAAVH